ncbi:nucleotide-binding domain-containing protein [Xylariaceae sp. FL1272]|nr:nucleotide-binding domain-containing protein [Xylariaceae sp. FL1272]
MTKITIFGAGVTGMTIASQLPRDYEITIVARDLPGDDLSQDWASPWACAGWVALGGSPLEEQMQLDALAFCRKLAASHPESSVRLNKLTDVYDVGATTVSDLWYRDRVPDFEVLDASQFALKGEETRPAVAVRYLGFALTPAVFLPWLRKRLEDSGVKFQRIDTVKSIADLEHFGHDVLINASGVASSTLEDIKDEQIITDRTYVTVVKSKYPEAFVRRCATEYTYIFGRHDGTAVLGGISEPVQDKVQSSAAIRKDLIRRANANLPEYFPSANVEDYEFVQDLVGIRPLRLPNVRVEKDVIGKQKVVHAYGTTIGAYMYAFGLAREAVRLVDHFVFEE